MSAEVTQAERFTQAANALAAVTVMRPLTEAQRAQLASPLPRDAVKTLPTKNAPVYVTGHYIVTRLNTVFGHDGWEDFYEAPVVREGPRPTITVRGYLRAGGVTRWDVGVGVAADSGVDAFETAMKAAYTDTLKRCARKLGDSFGLALYEKLEKGQQRSGVGLSTTALALLDELELLETLDAINAWAKANGAHVAKLDRDEQDIIKGDTAARRRACTPVAPHEPGSASEPPPHFEEPPAAPREPAPEDPPALRDYRQCVGGAASVDELVAVHLRSVESIRGLPAPAQKAAQDIIRTRVVALNVVPAAFATLLDEARKISTDPAHWNIMAVALARIALAPTTAEVAAVVKQLGPKVATLPEALRSKMNTVRSERLKQLAPPASKPAAREYDELLALIEKATTGGQLKLYESRLLQLAAEGKIAQKQADSLGEAMGVRAEGLGYEPVINGQERAA